MSFSWTEIIIYLMPFLTLFLALYFRQYLNDGRHIHLLPIDVMHPILWLCFHYLTETIFYFSLLPLYFIILGILGLWGLYQEEKLKGIFCWTRFFRKLSKRLFVLTSISYLLMLIVRFIQVIIK